MSFFFPLSNSSDRFQTFSVRHSIYVLELASSLMPASKEGLTITVRHCLILVTAGEYLALRYGLAGGLGSGAVLGAGWRVSTPGKRFLRPNGVAMTCAGHCQLRWTQPFVISSSDALSMK